MVLEQPISDEIIIDYILHHLSTKDRQDLSALIEADASLRTRVDTWQEMLFQLNKETTPVAPSSRVWQGVEQQLFEEKPHPAVSQKGQFWRYLVPAFFSLMLLFIGSFYFSHRPVYQTIVVSPGQQALWQVQGNEESIQFVSLVDVSLPNANCIAWIETGDKQIHKLGVIPDTGGQKTLRISLPASIQATVGSRIIIARVDKNYTESLPPSNPKILDFGELIEI